MKTSRTALSLNDRHSKCRHDLESRDQGHLLRWWDTLDSDSQSHLLREIESIPWSLVDSLLHSHVLNKPEERLPANLVPPTVYRRIPSEDNALYDRAKVLGKQLLCTGKVAAFTVAGGQGTRLGFEGPKGAVTITPVREKTLFQLFAEMIRAARDRYAARILWYIMTNPINHQQTVGFLKDHGNFGLPIEDVVLFCQGMLPSFDFQGKLLMVDKAHLAWAPDGHGGSLKSLAASGALRQMKSCGIETVSYFQVDNPLVHPFDELFVGLHRITGSEMSTKVAPKVDDLERVGNVCLADGRTVVVEYSMFPEELARAKNANGARRFNVGNLGIHMLEVAFIERIAGHRFELPYHRAEKIVAAIDENGFQRTPSSANAVKLETFVFDALPLAKNPLLLEVDREEEFSPVKNAKGKDSVETAIRDQIRRAARWLESAGTSIPYDTNGEPDIEVEIAPSYAMTAEDVRGRITHPPKLSAGETLYMS